MDEARFDFEAIYKRYPRKEGKKAGMAKLAKTITTNAEYHAFRVAVGNYVALCERENREYRYIKHWATFVSGWEDYAVAIPPAKPKTILRNQIDRILKGTL